LIFTQAYFQHSSVSADEKRVSDVADRAIRLVWWGVKEAVEERRKPKEKRDENVVLKLYPLTAMGAAVSSVVEGPLKELR
jgi:hypothetical protein